jgi:hypothetical protein
MDYKSFCKLMIKLSSESDEREPDKNELKYMYERYLIVKSKLSSRTQPKTLATRFISFKNFDKKQRLSYREKCSNEGIEFTPDQINFYINMLVITGSEYLEKRNGI